MFDEPKDDEHDTGILNRLTGSLAWLGICRRRAKLLFLGLDNTGNTFDVGSNQLARPMWRDYLSGVHGIVFVVDASGQDRFAEAKTELCALYDVQELDKVPFLVLGNKIDAPEAVSEEELREVLGLINPPYTKKGAVEIFMCSVAEKQGYGCGLRWLVGNIWTQAEVG
ncbi:small COPII coat GTPase sar1 [Coniochaeta sp. 2T2.1]|nr:small COPII coat GTPase sar1 [Coniochaeta sp. 2T2.1]